MRSCQKLNLAALVLFAAVFMMAAPTSAQQQRKPNIQVIMGDDIGYWNISAYNRDLDAAASAAARAKAVQPAV